MNRLNLNRSVDIHSNLIKQLNFTTYYDWNIIFLKLLKIKNKYNSVELIKNMCVENIKDKKIEDVKEPKLKTGRDNSWEITQLIIISIFIIFLILWILTGVI